MRLLIFLEEGVNLNPGSMAAFFWALFQSSEDDVA